MKTLTSDAHKKIIVLMLIVLGFANVVVWGGNAYKYLPTKTLYSSGVFFSTDGILVRFSDRLTLKSKDFNYSIKYSWAGKNNSMQEVGVASFGLRGDVVFEVNKSSSFGSNILNELDLDEDIIFNRTYMQSGVAKLSVLPLLGEFKGICYYLVNSKKVYCGTEKSRQIIVNNYKSGIGN